MDLVLALVLPYNARPCSTGGVRCAAGSSYTITSGKRCKTSAAETVTTVVIRSGSKSQCPTAVSRKRRLLDAGHGGVATEQTFRI